MSEAEGRHKAVYGRGLFDGLRMAGIDNPGEFMNEAKMQKKEEGLNGMARKVLDAVPIQSPWAKEKIVAELRRTGSNAGRDVIESCLNLLRGNGLIREPESGQFIRVEVKPKSIPAEIKIVHSVSTPKAVEVQKILVAVKADIPMQILEAAEAAKALWATLDTLAISAQSEIDKARTENALPLETLAALKTLGLIKA